MLELMNTIFIQDLEIFEHVLPLACFICTKRNCIGGKISGFCKMRERVEIPMYNNMIEFGVSGKHFPERGFIEIRINNLCFLEVSITKTIKKNNNNIVSIQIRECFIEGIKQICTKTSFKNDTFDFKFDNFHCFYFGAAFYQKDK
ncbi:hypothetical protein Avbf_09325, partial [Armadillidium vulgare]